MLLRRNEPAFQPGGKSQRKTQLPLWWENDDRSNLSSSLLHALFPLVVLVFVVVLTSPNEKTFSDVIRRVMAVWTRLTFWMKSVLRPRHICKGQTHLKITSIEDLDEVLGQALGSQP